MATKFMALGFYGFLSENSFSHTYLCIVHNAFREYALIYMSNLLISNH